MTDDHSRPFPEPPEETPASPGAPSVVVLDVANVMGSRPDGWWRDRAGAAARVLAGGAAACAAAYRPGARSGVVAVVAVLEGAARAAADPGVAGLEVVRAPGSGDDTVVEVAHRLVGSGAGRVVVVTADRGLRERLPAGADAAGPRWWWDVVEQGPRTATTPGA